MSPNGPQAMNLRLPLSAERSVWVTWPDHGLSEEEWTYMMQLLEAMKPGLIRPAHINEYGMTIATTASEPDPMEELIAAADRGESINLGEHEYIPSAWLDGRPIND